jgi:hypothetical protein
MSDKKKKQSATSGNLRRSFGSHPVVCRSINSNSKNGLQKFKNEKPFFKKKKSFLAKSKIFLV